MRRYRDIRRRCERTNETATGKSKSMISQPIGQPSRDEAGAPAAPVPPPHPGASAVALLDSAPVAVYHTDAFGNLIYSNPAYRRMFGLQPGHSPDAWAERIHPDDRARMESAWANFCLQPTPSRFAFRTRAIEATQDGEATRADGATNAGEPTIRHFSEQVVAVDGAPGWVGTITDFTDLVTARDNLRKAETLFRNTFDQAPIGIVHADRRGKFLRFNAA